MKFVIKKILLGLMILFIIYGVKAQEPITSPTPLIVESEDEMVCGLTSPPLIELNVSVWSSKKGYLKNLTYKDFEIYDEKEFQNIEFFTFDESINQYTMGFSQTYYERDNKWHNVEIKIKLSKEKRKGYGKISVEAEKGYYSGDPKFRN